MAKKKLDNYANFSTAPKYDSPIFQNLSNAYSKGLADAPEFAGDYSITSPTKYDIGTIAEDTSNIERIRGERQPWYSQVGAFANQSVLGEVVGGTLMTIGALAEIPQLIYDGLTESESGFTNAIYEAGDNLSKWTRDVTPIYQTGDRFTDSGWWFQNGVSVASAASMLLPGAAVAKGIGKLGQLMKWSKTATDMAATGLGSLAMRHAENFREANGVFQSIYNEAISKGLDEETARQNASDAAALDYGANYANLAFDMVQLGALMKPTKAWTRNIGSLDYDLAKGLGKLPESKLGRAMYWSKDKLLPQMSEGVEEVINTISQKESERYGKILNDPTTKDDTHFMQRLGDYLGEAETIDSFLWGVAGGAAFQGIGKLLGIDESSSVVKNKLAEVAKRQETLGNYMSNISSAINKESITDNSGNIIEDFSTSDKSDIDRYVGMQLDKMAFDLSQSASRAGNVDLLLEHIESPDFKQQMVQSGMVSAEEANERISKIKSEIELGEKLYKQSFNRYYNLDVPQEVKNYLTDKTTALEYGRAKVAEMRDNLSREFNTNYSQDEYLKAYGANPVVQNTIDVMSHQMAIEGLTQQLKTAKEDDKADIENTISKLQQSLKNIQANRFGTVDPNLINPSVYESKARQLVFQHQFDNLSEDIAKEQSPENIKKTEKKVEETKKNINTNIANNQVVKKATEKAERVAANKSIIKDKEAFTLKPEEVPTQEEIDKTFETGEEEVVDVLGEEFEDVIPDVVSGDVTPQSSRLQEYNTKKQELNTERNNILSQYDAFEAETGEKFTNERAELEEAYKANLNKLNKEYVDAIPEGEKLEAHVEDIVEKTSNTPEGFDEDSVRKVNVDTESIDNEFLDNEKIKKLKDSYNAMARLDREYAIRNGKYQEVSNDLHPNLYKPILNSNKYAPGTGVTLRVADRNDIPVTDPVTGMVTTWGSIKNSVDYNEQVPIEIVDNDGNVLGYYHDVNWTSNSDKVANPVEDTEEVKKIRKYIISKGEVKTTITENRFGVLNRTMDNKKYPVKDIVEDPNVTIAVAENDVELFDRNDLNLINNFSTSPLHKGWNYMVVQVGKKLGTDAYLALPLSNITYDELSKTDSELFHKIHYSIEAAINIYLKNGDNLTREEKNLYDSVRTNLDLELASPQGIVSYLGAFLHNDKKRPFGERSQFKFEDGNITFRRKKPIKGQVTQFFVGKNVKDKKKMFQIFHDNIESMLKSQFFNTSKEYVNENRELPLLTESGEVETMDYLDLVKSATKTNIMGKEVDTNSDGSKVYSYTIQKVIRFDTSFAEPKPTGTDDTTTEIINDIVEFTEDVEYEELLPQDFNFVDDGYSFAITEDKFDSLSNSLNSLLVKDLGFARQEDIVNYIIEKSLSKLSENKSINIKSTTDELRETFSKNINTVDFNIKKLKSNILKAKQSNKLEDVARFEQQLAELENFKNLLGEVNKNWNSLVGFAIKRLERLNGIKIVDNQDDDTEFENDLFEIEGDENANWKESDLTTDRKKSLSRDVKLFCSGIVDLKSDGQPNKTWIGTNRLMSFDTVYNTVQALTPNLPPNLDVIKEELSKSVDAFPWLKDFINKLDNAKDSTKKSIVKALTNYYSNTTSYKYNKDDKGNYHTQIFESDSSSMGKVILNSWESNFNRSKLITYDEGNKLDENAVNGWLERFENLKQTKGTNVTIEEINNLLNEVGVVLSKNALDSIKNNGLPISKKKTIKLNTILSDAFSPLVVIKDFLELNKDDVLTTKLTTNTAIEKLAQLQNRYESKLHSNSQKSGGRTIFSYGKPKFFINRFRRFNDFIEGKDVEMGKVLTSPFVTNLLWAKSIKDINKREAFMANFDYEIADLEPISELGKKSRKGRELNNVSPAEVELYRLFGVMAKRADKSGGKNRVISLMHPTTSDKTTVHSIVTLAADLKFNPDGTLTNESYKILFDNLILPEITRIRHFEALQAKGVDISRYEGWADGWNKFMVIPEMNTYDGTFIGDKLNPDLESSFQQVIDSVLKPHIEALVAEKAQLWDKYSIGNDEKNYKGQVVETKKFLDKQYVEYLSSKGAKDNVRTAAMYDMVAQYLIGNTNTWGLFNTDPAQYFDKKAVAAWNKGDKIGAIAKVFENMGKRLAADVAPGEESVANDSGTITYAFIKDPKVTSLRFEQLKEQFGDSIATAYKDMDGTDAQEFVTLQEHLFNMDADGLLPDGMYDIVANTIKEELSRVDENGNPTPNHYYTEAIISNLNAVNPELADKYKEMVFQVKKPVYVENIFDTDLRVERRIYVKSSAYPLTPELCAKVQLDDIRIAMEQQGIQRLAFATATKVGNYKKNVELFGDDRNVKSNIDFSASKMVVPRSGLRDQMPVPYDEMKKEIKKVSQASKNLFVNIKDVPGMAELEQEYLDTYHEIFKEQYAKLQSEVLNENGTLNIQNLREILLEEAAGRGYPLSDFQMLELDENLRLLPFSPNAAKYESLLNSIVENRVDKVMLPGKSFVLSTEMGYKAKPTAKLVGNAKNIERLKSRGLVTTRNFTGELLPQRIENGVVKPAQVIMPFKFRDNNGNLLHIEDFIDGDGFIDTNKLPESVLKLFGMRIPNQGPNSQSAIEIVGFMPHSAGDVIVATKDYLAQMGSDFDVDKLYAYMYETEYKNGRIVKKDSLKNRIVDIHLQIHANPDPRVQRQIAKPIGEWKLKDIAAEVVKLKPQSTVPFSPASDSYQKMKFINATASKSGVGTYSVASMFVANMQGKNLIYRVTDEEGNKVPINLSIGNTTWNGDISNIFTIRSQKLIQNAGGYDNLTDDEKKQLTYKSEVVEGHQSVAVDNEKLQLMDKTNDNKFTFNYTIAAMAAGFEDELVWLRSQPIIFDYVEELQFLKSPLSGFFGNAETEAYHRVVKKYGFTEDMIGESKPELLTIENMKECISGESTNFRNIQNAAIETFLQLHEVGLKIQSVTSATNTDSKGIGITMLSNYAKQQAVENLVNSPIENAEKLLGNFNVDGKLVEPTTIAGFATKYGLETANNYWSNLFPYQTNSVQEMFNKILELTGSDEVGFTSKANTQQDIWTDFKSYLFSRNDLGITEDGADINAERDRLFIDRKDKKGNVTKKSFIAKMQEISELPEMKRRPFINRLNFFIDYKDNKNSRVSFNASAAENLEEIQIYQDIIDLLVNDRPIPNSDMTSRQMMEDLIKTQYLGGGIQEAIQFIKYIPAQYYYLIPFAEKLSNTWNELNAPNNPWLNFNADTLPNFIEQYIQHNPNKVTDVKMKSFTHDNSKNIIITDENIITKKDDEKTSEPYVKRYNPKAEGNKTELFKFTGKFCKKGFPIYEQIPTLGGFGMSEYNANLPQGSMQTSLLMITPETKKIETKDTVNTSNTGSVELDNPLNKLNKVEETAISLGLSTQPTDLKSVLEKTSVTTSNPYYQLLSSEMVGVTDKTTISINTAIDADGVYDHYADDIKINTNSIQNLAKLADIILHEGIHAITSKTIKQYLADKSKLPVKVREACASLDTLRNTLKDKVKDTKEYKEYLSKQARRKRGEKVVFTNDEASKFAPLDDLFEFVAYSLTRPDTQKWLNSIEYKKDQTALDRFKDLLNKIFFALKGMGFEIKSGTALSTAFKNSVVVLNAQELYESDATVDKNINTNIKFEEDRNYGYRERTMKNASADATIAIAIDFSTAGEILTRKSVLNQKNKYIPIQLTDLSISNVLIDSIVTELNSVNKMFGIELNIAGNGIYTFKNKMTQQQLDDYVYNLLFKVVNSPNLRTKINSIRSGGQTGIDESGAKAGVKLGLPTTVLAPLGWKFRDINSKDVSDEQKFKQRFIIESDVTISKPTFDINIYLQKDVINVYWGKPESPTSTRILSNLAPRKFKYESVDGITREYGSVEHAYQSNKNGKFDKNIYDKYVERGGYGVKIAPKLTEVGKRGNLQVMKDLVVESFIQNPNSEAADKLLQYKNFTHDSNELIDKAFLEGLKLAQKELLIIRESSMFTLKLEDFTEGDVIESYAVFEEEPFNSLPSKKDIYSQFKVWDDKLNRPKTWSMSVDRNNLVKIANNINKNNEIYHAKVEQQPFLDKGKYNTKQYIQLTLNPEFNNLNTRIEYLMKDRERLDELMKTCKY